MAALEQKRDGFLTHYLEPLGAWLDDENIAEIVVNPDGKIWIERASAAAMVDTGARMAGPDALRLARQIAGQAGHRLSPENPIAGCKLPLDAAQTLRVQIVTPPIVETVAIAIRRVALKKFSLDDLAARGVLEMVAACAAQNTRKPAPEDDLKSYLSAAVKARKTILISGGTSTGKTTFLRALLGEADAVDRLVTIEDAYELHPDQPNAVAMLASRRADAEGVADAASLLEAALRIRPDRIILGELRGAEAYAFLEAINTGHPGGLATIHADDPETAFERLALMVMRANRGLAREEIITYVRSLVDIVVQLGRDTNGARRVRAIKEVS